MAVLQPQKIKIKDFKEITIAIDDLDDIFSDFDPRPIPFRTISEDFLYEIQRLYRETPLGKVSLTLLAPVVIKKVISKSEKAINNRLIQDFKRRALENKKSIMRIKKRGWTYVIFGTTLLLILTLLGYFKVIGTLSFEIIGVVLMPLGWFGVWEGFSKLVEIPFKLQERYAMYNKFSKVQYKFKYLGEPKIVIPR